MKRLSYGLMAILVLLVLSGCSKPKQKLEQYVKDIVHAAYFEGQRAALEGEVHIQKVGDRYVWVSSPDENADELPRVTDGDSLLKVWE